jgi:hypothetical protein
MNQKGTEKAIATKIKKWLQTATQLSNEEITFALPITRLTSIKSLCTDEIVAQQFALYFSKRMQQEMNQPDRSEHLTQSEWETHLTLIADAIVQMESYLTTSSDRGKQSILFTTNFNLFCSLHLSVANT